MAETTRVAQLVPERCDDIRVRVLHAVSDTHAISQPGARAMQ
jgi:hypothetical protein